MERLSLHQPLYLITGWARTAEDYKMTIGFRNTIIMVLAASAMALAAGAASAQDTGIGARALGMGGAFTAVADDISAPYWNPAGEAQSKGFRMELLDVQARFAVEGNTDLSDLVNHFPTGGSSLDKFADTFGTHVTDVDASLFSGLSYGGYGISGIGLAMVRVTPYQNYDAATNTFSGAQHLNFTNGVVTSGAVKLQGYAGGAGLITGAWHLPEKTMVGVNLKVINTYGVTGHATFDTASNSFVGGMTTNGKAESTFAIDAGALHPVNKTLMVGAILRDLGGPAAAPTEFTVGAAWRPVKSHLLVAGDLENIGNSGPGTHLNLGAEYNVAKILQLRVGEYRGRATLGFGLGKFFNVAISPDSSMVGISLGF
jgi:hypothetical protein